MSIKQEDIDLATFSGAQAVTKRANNVNIDFKMITFTLAGKRYGIDIMKVKEIRKAGNFTYVPNIEHFVRGVDNLRGDIIPIIDMRLMFSLPVAERSGDELENVIVLRFGDTIIGIVVDAVEKVVGLTKANIRPPHPLFGDINIRYISGVIEENGHLYVILNVDEIFLPEKALEEQAEAEPAAEEVAVVPSSLEKTPQVSSWQASIPAEEVEETHAAALALWEGQQEQTTQSSAASEEQGEENGATSRIVDLVMSLEEEIGDKEKGIAARLEAEEHFFLSPLNKRWFLKQKSQWETAEPSTEEIIREFYSPGTNELWNGDLFQSLVELVENHLRPELIKNVMVPGCGEGHDAYVVACALKKVFGDARFKVWASDNNLIHILGTQSLSYPVETLPTVYLDYMLNTNSGLQFDSDIKEAVLFEYSDITHSTADKQVGLIVAYDLLSFLSQEDQVQVLKRFAQQLDEGGLLIVGYHEEVSDLLENWTLVPCEGFKVYKKQV